MRRGLRDRETPRRFADVRLVRSAAQGIKMRCGERADKGGRAEALMGRRWITAARRRRVMAASTSGARWSCCHREV